MLNQRYRYHLALLIVLTVVILIIHTISLRATDMVNLPLSMDNQNSGDSSGSVLVENYMLPPPNLLLIQFDRNDYYTFDTRICPNNGENITVTILVISAPTNQIQRGHIRKTWGHYGTRSDIGFGFVIGRSANEILETDLRNENRLYNDIIRVDFIDSYNNLTLKSVSALNWIDTFCNETRFYLKSDDDMFINVSRLLQFLETVGNANRTIFGHLATNWKPFRNKDSKYYLSRTDFPHDTFGPFTSGPSYLMTIDCVHDLFSESLVACPLKLEDVFITGITADKLNITRVNVVEFTNDDIFKANLSSTALQIISKHQIKPHFQFDMWKFSEMKSR